MARAVGNTKNGMFHASTEKVKTELQKLAISTQRGLVELTAEVYAIVDRDYNAVVNQNGPSTSAQRTVRNKVAAIIQNGLPISRDDVTETSLDATDGNNGDIHKPEGIAAFSKSLENTELENTQCHR